MPRISGVTNFENGKFKVTSFVLLGLGLIVIGESNKFKLVIQKDRAMISIKPILFFMNQDLYTAV